MIISSAVLTELLEPALFALRSGRRSEVGHVLQEARRAARTSRQQLRRDATPVHQPSFDLGVASTFVELLGTAEQRGTLQDVLDRLRRSSDGLQILHEVALVARSAPVQQRELAAQLGVDPGNFSRKVKTLIELGLVNSARYGRGLTYAPTPLGEDVLDELRPGWRATSPSDLRTFFETEGQASAAAMGLLDNRMRAPTPEPSMTTLLSHRRDQAKPAGTLLSTGIEQLKQAPHQGIFRYHDVDPVVSQLAARPTPSRFQVGA